MYSSSRVIAYYTLGRIVTLPPPLPSSAPSSPPPPPPPSLTAITIFITISPSSPSPSTITNRCQPPWPPTTRQYRVDSERVHLHVYSFTSLRAAFPCLSRPQSLSVLQATRFRLPSPCPLSFCLVAYRSTCPLSSRVVYTYKPLFPVLFATHGKSSLFPSPPPASPSPFALPLLLLLCPFLVSTPKWPSYPPHSPELLRPSPRSLLNRC